MTHPKKPEKVGVIFDCAAKYQGTSLNDQTLQGPDLTNSLTGVLIRFREEQIALMADIEAMFHQVRVALKDVNALRFLWFAQNDLRQEPEEFQMLVHLFVGRWSSGVSNFALQKTADDNKDLFDAETVKTVHRNFHVDDLLKSVRKVKDAKKLYEQLTQMLASGGFHLTKWICNNHEVLDVVPQSEMVSQLRNLSLDIKALPIERAPGLEWNVEGDCFQFSISQKDNPHTRRGILSKVSSIFDPLGFVAPFVLSVKIILQRLYKKGLGWDEIIPEEDLFEWQKWLADLPKLE